MTKKIRALTLLCFGLCSRCAASTSPDVRALSDGDQRMDSLDAVSTTTDARSIDVPLISVDARSDVVSEPPADVSLIRDAIATDVDGSCNSNAEIVRGSACEGMFGVCVSATRGDGPDPIYTACCPQGGTLPGGGQFFSGRARDLVGDTLRLGCPTRADADFDFSVCCIVGDVM